MKKKANNKISAYVMKQPESLDKTNQSTSQTK